MGGTAGAPAVSRAVGWSGQPSRWRVPMQMELHVAMRGGAEGTPSTSIPLRGPRVAVN